MRIAASVILALITWLFSAAQELNCQVEVNTDKVQGYESLFQNLQQAMNDYLNTTRFTNTQFSPVEKIQCRLFLTVNEYTTDDVVKGDLQIQSTRPIYNSAYNSTLLNFKDNKIEFSYRENEPLIFTENTMENNLTAILNYYAYLILALDFDSFSPRGGDPWFERLATIVQQAQSSGEVGWKTFEDNRNRAAVLAAYTEPNTSVLRDMLYQYHRKGLDEMSISPDKGRATITKSLEALKRVYEVAPMSVGLSMWRDSKLDEVVNIYSKGTQDEREGVYQLLMDIYPAEQSRLVNIKNPPETR